MGNTPPRSFNTVKNSNREQRAKRKKQARQVFLAIILVAILIVVTAFVLLICSVVHAIISNQPTDEVTPPTNDEPTATEIVYTAATVSSADVHKGDLILVSEKQGLQYVFPSVSNMVLIEELRKDQNGVRPYQTRVLREDEKLLSDAAYAANQMLTDFYLKFGDNSLILMDSYRSQKDQETYSSTPVGFSEHHTGLVFTIRTYDANNKVASLSQNAMSDWIYENCHKYGIICRYPTDKEAITGVNSYNYCFRYVGVAHATYMKQHNLCLEEYIELLKSTYSNGSMLDVVDGETAYKIYYVSAASDELTTVTVPQNYKYTVSGDNSTGFIVTIYCNSPITE